MHSGDDDPALCRHDCGQRFRSPQQWRAGGACRRADRIVFPDGGRIDHELSVLRILRAMLRVKAKSKALETIDLPRDDLV